VTVSEETSLEHAAQTLHNHEFGALPVDAGWPSVGILTDSDLMRCLIDLLAHGG
jgi:CBS-domain-containing membrane protein